MPSPNKTANIKLSTDDSTGTDSPSHSNFINFNSNSSVYLLILNKDTQVRPKKGHAQRTKPSMATDEDAPMKPKKVAERRIKTVYKRTASPRSTTTKSHRR